MRPMRLQNTVCAILSIALLRNTMPILLRFWFLLVLVVLPALQAAQDVTLRVMFVAATPETAQEINRMGGIQTFAQQCLGATMVAFRNSGINNVKVEYVHSTKWDSMPWRNLLHDAEQAQQTAPEIDRYVIMHGLPSIEAERMQLNADMVISICNDPNSKGLLGISGGAVGHPQDSNKVDISARSHYLAMRVGYNVSESAISTFVHELGHCFGCGHAENQGIGNGPLSLPVSCGVQSTESCGDAAMRRAFNLPANARVGHRTIMAYEFRSADAEGTQPEQNLLFVLTKHPCFSHPGTDTLPVGNTRYTVGDREHNNASVIKQSASQLAAKVPYGNDSYQKAMNLSDGYLKRHDSGLAAIISDSNLFAAMQREPDVPMESAAGGANRPAGKSLWYQLTAPADAVLNIITAHLGKGCLYIYRTQNGQPVRCAEAVEYGGGEQGAPPVNVSAGETILIRMDAAEGYPGGAYEMGIFLSPVEGAAPLPEQEGDSRGGSPQDSCDPETGHESSSAFSNILLLLLIGTLFGSAARMIYRGAKIPSIPAPQREVAHPYRFTPIVPEPLSAPQTPPQQHRHGRPQVEHQYTLVIAYPNGRQEAAVLNPQKLSAGMGINLGSASDNDIIVRDGAVSRHHAQFKLKPDGLQVKDLGSTNGTVIPHAGIRLGANQGALIRWGDTLILGRIKIHIQ